MGMFWYLIFLFYIVTNVFMKELWFCFISPRDALKLLPEGECAMDPNHPEGEARGMMDPLHIHPREAISMHPEGLWSKSIV